MSQARTLAFIFSGIFYALGVLFLFGDSINRWGTELQKQYAPGNPLAAVADFVKGIGLSTDGQSVWVIPCILLGAVSTAVAIVIGKKKGAKK
jgi:hypothetical protein